MLNYAPLSLFLLSTSLLAQDTLKLDTTIIKGSTESPQILYIVPWKELAIDSERKNQLILYSLEDDLFEPVIPLYTE